MKGRDLLRGMNHVNAKYVEEAEAVTQLKGKPLFRYPLMVAALIALMLVVGCGIAFAGGF